MNADEKAVAELFPCYEPNDIGECSPGGDHFKDCPANAAFRRRATAPAARIRAEASGEVAALRKALEIAKRQRNELLRATLDIYVKAEDAEIDIDETYRQSAEAADMEIDAALKGDA